MAARDTELAAAASRRLFDTAQRLIPGGVNSPVRAFARVGGNPFFVDRAEGVTLHDVDGNAYSDYVMSWGALMLGHTHPAVTHAIQQAAVRGTSYGAPSGAEIELAQLIIDLVPSIEMVRFVNSGTEATMSAVRLARAATRRDVILKFDGCYHGHGDSFLVRAGSGVATLGLPDSPGVPSAVAELTLSIPFNDVDALCTAFDMHGERIACAIVEPIIGNAGFIAPRQGFHVLLRELTARFGALLIFDEVMTGFRVGPGGAQERFGITPDLTTLGKVIGGGLPVGAYGGRRDLMELIAPAGPVYQAGTLSGNPLAMAAGIAQLLILRETNPWAELEHRARRLVRGIGDAAARFGVPFQADVAGAMLGWHFASEPVHDFAAAARSDTALFARFHRACLEHGVFLPPSPFEAAFISTAHTDDVVDEDLERMIAALGEAA